MSAPIPIPRRGAGASATSSKSHTPDRLSPVQTPLELGEESWPTGPTHKAHVSSSPTADFYYDSMPATVTQLENGEDLIEAISQLCAARSSGEGFYCNDMRALEYSYARWTENLPRVIPHYAVKCNNDPVLLKVLYLLGTGFDAASEAELRSLIALGVPPDRIVHANPMKRTGAIEYSRAVDVRRMTFDSLEELDKIKAHFPDALLILRVHVSDAHSIVKLGAKFGAHADMVRPLLEGAKARALAVIGVSFHVGSGCTDPIAFYDAIAVANGVFTVATELGFDFTLLDIGGGFPGKPRSDDPRCPLPTRHVEYRSHAPGTSQNPALTFEEIAVQINRALDEFFPPSRGVTLIAEPGRYFAQTYSTLVVNVYGARTDTVPVPQRHLFLDTGLYGGLNNVVWDGAMPTVQLLKAYQHIMAGKLPDMGEPVQTTMWGPTCDSMDCIRKDVPLPPIAVGDWLLFFEFGAYSQVASCVFNGISTPEQIHVRSAVATNALLPADVADALDAMEAAMQAVRDCIGADEAGEQDGTVIVTPAEE